MPPWLKDHGGIFVLLIGAKPVKSKTRIVQNQKGAKPDWTGCLPNKPNKLHRQQVVKTVVGAASAAIKPGNKAKSRRQIRSVMEECSA